MIRVVITAVVFEVVKEVNKRYKLTERALAKIEEKRRGEKDEFN